MKRSSNQIYPLPSGKSNASFCRWFRLNSKRVSETELCTKCCEGQKEEKLNEGNRLHPSGQQEAGSDKCLAEAHPKGCWGTEDGKVGSPTWTRGILRASWRDSFVTYLGRPHHRPGTAKGMGATGRDIPG